MLAARNGNKKIVELLLSYKANTELQDKFGKKAWERTNSLEIQQLLKPLLKRNKNSSKIIKPEKSIKADYSMINIEEPDINRLERIAEQNVQKFAEQLNRKEPLTTHQDNYMNAIPKENSNKIRNEYEYMTREEVEKYVDNKIQTVIQETIIKTQSLIKEVINEKINSIEKVIINEIHNVMKNYTLKQVVTYLALENRIRRLRVIL